MKLKVRPDDFRVRETLDFVEDREGPYFVHVLRKTKLDTLEAIAIVAARAEVDRAKIAFAGLKDRQGVTEQWISIEGRRLDFRGDGVQLKFVGRSAVPVTSKMSRGNEFSLVLRDLERRDWDRLQERLPALERYGFIDFFDTQRFACLRHGQGFVMRDVLRGRFEHALKALVATPSPVAITGDVKLKQLLATHWGDWERCASMARGPVWQRLFRQLLSKPYDFRAALELLPSRQKLIHAYAYQSYLWNRAIDLTVKRLVPPGRRLAIDTRASEVAAWFDPPAEAATRLREMRTPLYGPDGDGGDPIFKSAMGRVLEDAGFGPQAFRDNEVAGMVLREEPRLPVVMPRDLRVGTPESDEEHEGRRRVRIDFALPRGAYATMFIKHLFARPERRGSRPVGPRPRSTRNENPHVSENE